MGQCEQRARAAAPMGNSASGPDPASVQLPEKSDTDVPMEAQSSGDVPTLENLGGIPDEEDDEERSWITSSKYLGTNPEVGYEELAEVKELLRERLAQQDQVPLESSEDEANPNASIYNALAIALRRRESGANVNIRNEIWRHIRVMSDFEVTPGVNFQQWCNHSKWDAFIRDGRRGRLLGNFSFVVLAVAAAYYKVSIRVVSGVAGVPNGGVIVFSTPRSWHIPQVLSPVEIGHLGREYFCGVARTAELVRIKHLSQAHEARVRTRRKAKEQQKQIAYQSKEEEIKNMLMNEILGAGASLHPLDIPQAGSVQRRLSRGLLLNALK